MSLTVTSRILFVYICAYIMYILYIYIALTKLSQTSLALSIPPH